MTAVGLIGVGRMGHGIARHICLSDDYQLQFLTHRGNQPVDDIIAAGGKAVDSLSELGQSCRIFALCVTGAPEVEQLICGRDGLIHHAEQGSIFIDLSTGLPERTLMMADRLHQAGFRFADAAMTRTPKEAEQGRLNLIVGADDALFAEIKPFLACFSEHITHAGKAGDGQRLKLIHNYVSLGFASILAEAGARAADAAISPERLTEVLEQGGGRSVALDRLAPYFEHKDDGNLQFTLANAAKDIGYYIQSCGKSAPAEALLDQLCQAVEKIGSQASVPSLTDYLRRNRTSSQDEGVS